MRGDPPDSRLGSGSGESSTPHARGSTFEELGTYAGPWVYPACAGIHLMLSRTRHASYGLPRMRGDPPPLRGSIHTLSMSTPHARGSTQVNELAYRHEYVYPACAGIHRMKGEISVKKGGLPRMRGDPPYTKHLRYTVSQSTPHARGSTHTNRGPSARMAVYPACAGIHPPAVER